MIHRTFARFGLKMLSSRYLIDNRFLKTQVIVSELEKVFIYSDAVPYKDSKNILSKKRN